MNYKMIYIFLFLALSGCQQKEHKEIIGKPNPASVYCAQLHGKSTPIITPEGEYVICTLPNGEKIEEWALFRRDHTNSNKN